MARISYIAVLSRDPQSLADFYARHFDFEELGRSPDGDISLTDGGFNLTLLRHREELKEPRMEVGLHHLGIAVESIDEVVKRYLECYPRGTVREESGDLWRGQMRIHDPECNPVSLSENNFGLDPVATPRVPRIAHVALNALDPETVEAFYQDLFGYPELWEAHAKRRYEPGYRNRHVGDGHTNVAIQNFYDGSPGHEARMGIAHIGMLVPDSAAMAEQIKDTATITRRPAERTQSEARMRDPEGNGCDLSQRGWEVEIDSWARADA
ncbi:MAG TPA: VOC family protein [Alphaproteobacteria bacterium]|nr:VOC family protein [Alphaproteobacteria bacterium]